MGIYSNSPTMTWISLTGISVTKGDEVFVVKDFKTNLKYIYWDYTNPYVFTATNVIKDRSTNLFQVAINDKGSFIEVPQESIIVSYDGNSEKALSEHVWGLHEKADEFTNKFVSVEQNIDGITTTVGEHTEQMGLLEENISKVDQKADSINLSVQETKKEFNDNKEMMDLRESVNLSIINLNSALGVYKSLLNDYFKDNVISSDEKVQIQANNDILTEKKNIMLSEMDKVIALMQEQDNQTNIDTINRDKQLLEISITNLISLINTSISDNTIVPSEITTIINAFAKANLDINDIKNSLDNMIFLGIGGKLSEEVASIDIKSDKIVSKVESVEKTVTDQGTTISSHSSSITQMADEIETKVSAGEIASSINQTAQSVKIKASKIDLDGYVTMTNLETEGQTTIHGGNIETNTLSVDSLRSNNENPIIRLFPTTASDGTESYCSLDATELYEEGRGNAIRLKWDSMNYILQKKGSVDFYMEPREAGNAFGFQSDYGQYYSGNETRIITREGTLAFRGNGGLAFYTSSSNADRKLLTTYDLSSSVSSTSTESVATPYAVKQAYDRGNNAYSLANTASSNASSALSKANSAYSLANNALTSSDLPGNIYTSIYPGSSGSYHCGRYGNYWNYVVANQVRWVVGGGSAYLSARNADNGNGKVAYNFLKQYRKNIELKHNISDLLTIQSCASELSEEEVEQLEVARKVDELYDIDEKNGSTMYVKGSLLTETIGDAIEYMINKIEILEDKVNTINELENQVLELTKTVEDLINKIGG